MRKRWTALIIGIGIVFIVLTLISNKTVQREGIDERLAADSLEVVELIDLWNNEYDVRYDDLNDSTKEIIDNYTYKDYYTENEEPSEEERKIVDETYLAISGYTLNGKEFDDGVADYDEKIKESKERVQQLTGSVVNERDN